MERIPLEWLMEIPPVTRTYIVGVMSVSLLDYTGYLNKVDCYYSIDTVFHKGQYWRLLTSFLYFGDLSFDLILTLYVIVRHSKSLELSFPNSKDYIWCVFLLSISLLLYSSLVTNLFILGSYLNDTLLFIWSRRNPDVELTIMGLLNFKSVYLPFVSLIISKLLNVSTTGSINSVTGDLKADMAGILIGQVFIFLSDMYPRLHDCPSPIRPIWYWFQKDRADENEFQLDDIDQINANNDDLPVQELPRGELEPLQRYEQQQQQQQIAHEPVVGEPEPSLIHNVNDEPQPGLHNSEESRDTTTPILDPPEALLPTNDLDLNHEDQGEGLRQRGAR